jgi:hypothetical protein
VDLAPLIFSGIGGMTIMSLNYLKNNILPWEKPQGGMAVYLHQSAFRFRAVDACFRSLARSKMTQVFLISTDMEDGEEDVFELISYLLLHSADSMSFYGIYQSNANSENPRNCVRCYHWNREDDYVPYESVQDKKDFTLGDTQLHGGLYFPKANDITINMLLQEIREKIVQQGFTLMPKRDIPLEGLDSVEFFSCFDSIVSNIHYAPEEFKCPLLEDCIMRKYTQTIEQLINTEQYLPTGPVTYSYMSGDNFIQNMLLCAKLGQEWKYTELKRSM